MLKKFFQNAGILKNNNFYDPENLTFSALRKPSS